MADRK